MAALNVHNFKTKPPFDKWSSILYDKGWQNTDFVEKMMKAPPCVGAFQKTSTVTRSKQKEVQQFMNCKRSWIKRLL